LSLGTGSSSELALALEDARQRAASQATLFNGTNPITSSAPASPADATPIAFVTRVVMR
jgi:hypothetical protein